MPAPDITMQHRHHAYNQLAEQLQRLGKSAAQAGDMAKKVELAAYNKAVNLVQYMQLWQTSLRKAQTAIQQAQAQQQAQLAAQQQAHQRAQLAEQQAQQQAQLAQQQAQQQAQLAAQQQAQYAAQQQQHQVQQQQQQRAMLQRQQQQVQAQQQAQLQQHQVQYGAQPGALPAQQHYMSAPQQRQQVQQAPQQVHYMPQQAQQAQQPLQYTRQPAPQQYAQPTQPGGQQQYMPAGGQPQYMQMQTQPQPHQQQYAPQQAGGQSAPQQYMQQQPRAMQQAPHGHAAAARDPASLQAQVAHGQVVQQQQYGQAAPMAVPQHMGGRVPPPGAMQSPPGVQQQVLDTVDFKGGLAAPEAGSMLPHAMAYDPPRAQQAALPAASTTFSPVPTAVVCDSVAASAAAGPGRQLNHEAGSLQEFLRLHAAFNEPHSRATNIRDSENMIRWHSDLAKRDPNQAARLHAHVKRNSAVLAFLQSQRPAEQAAIKEFVLAAVNAFLRDLKGFKEHRKRSAAKAAAAQQAAAATQSSGGGGGPTVSSPASAGGYLAMMDSVKLDGSSSTVKLPSASSLFPPGSSLPQPGGSLAPPAGAAKPAPGRPPSAPGSAASVAAEAARHQALLRQRQVAAAASVEQQRRSAAAVPAGPPLPADPTQRLLAVAQQPCSQGEGAAVRGGFQRLQRALQMEEERQLAAQVADVSTPPLPPEAQRLVARERAALEAAAGIGASSLGTKGVVLTPAGQGHVAATNPATAAEEAGGQPPAKRARSASPDPLLGAGSPAAEAGGSADVQHAQRQRSELERRLVGECEEAAAALGGELAMRTSPDRQEAGCVAVACMPTSAQQQARESGIKPGWQLLTLRVPPGYPEQAPTAVFHRANRGGAPTAQAAAALQAQMQLADAAAEAFAARVAALPPPHRLLPLAQAWLDATRAVAARLAARQAVME